MLGRQHTEHFLDLVIGFAAAAKQRKEIVFLVNHMQWKVRVEKIEDLTQTLFIAGH